MPKGLLQLVLLFEWLADLGSTTEGQECRLSAGLEHICWPPPPPPLEISLEKRPRIGPSFGAKPAAAVADHQELPTDRTSDRPAADASAARRFKIAGGHPGCQVIPMAPGRGHRRLLRKTTGEPESFRYDVAEGAAGGQLGRSRGGARYQHQAGDTFPRVTPMAKGPQGPMRRGSEDTLGRGAAPVEACEVATPGTTEDRNASSAPGDMLCVRAVLHAIVCIYLRLQGLVCARLQVSVPKEVVLIMVGPL